MTWLQTFTGKKINPFDPDAEQFCIEDVAHHLALMNRFSGATRVPLNVADHCVRCTHAYLEMTGVAVDAVSNEQRQTALTVLMHDCAEVALCDVPRPIKSRLFVRNENAGLAWYETYKHAEDKLLAALATKFGFLFPFPDIVHEIDDRMLFTEKRDLLVPCDWGWEKEPFKDKIVPNDWQWSERAFLDMFDALKEVK